MYEGGLCAVFLMARAFSSILPLEEPRRSSGREERLDAWMPRPFYILKLLDVLILGFRILDLYLCVAGHDPAPAFPHALRLWSRYSTGVVGGHPSRRGELTHLFYKGQRHQHLLFLKLLTRLSQSTTKPRARTAVTPRSPVPQAR